MVTVRRTVPLVVTTFPLAALPLAMAPLALSGVQLASGMTASLSLIGWAVVPMDVFHPVTLQVIGEERIATATGSYDCWKLEVIAGADRRIEWVRKSDGLGLRSDDTGRQ